MYRIVKVKLIIGLVLIVFFSLLHSQETIIDTVYSIPELDGGIAYTTIWDDYGVGTSYGSFSAGDSWDAILGADAYARGFLAYPLPDIPENYHLTSATLFVFQYWSACNGDFGIYPIFNLDSGEVEPPCLIEHIDYGYSLDASDFHLPALHPANTISTTPEQGWRSVEITDWVVDDMENNRSYTQSRLRLSLNTDFDMQIDALGFSSGNHTIYKPYCIYEYNQDSNIENENEIEELSSGLKVNVFPNPISDNGKIMLTTKQTGNANLEIYNVKGQLVQTVFNGNIERGNKEILFNTQKLSSGIYLLKATSKNRVAIKKILIQK